LKEITMENKERPCIFEEKREEFEKLLLKKVKQMLNLEYDSLADRFNQYKEENKAALEDFKRVQDDTLKKFREDLITYFNDKFQPDFTQAIFEMNKTLVEKVVNGNFEIKKMQITGESKKDELDTKVKTTKMDMWKFILVALFGAFGVKVIDFIMEFFK